MITRGIIASLFLIFATVMTFSACDVISEKGLDESLDKVPNVTAIKGAENASITVNKGSNSFFSIDIDNVEWNTLISNGEREAYCIAWKDPISSDNSIYDGIGVYSTAGDKQFADVNRLFTMKNALQKADPEITWREIQVAVWSLVPFQEFDMNMPVDELPSRVRSNGEVNFDKDKVQFILDAVQNRSTAKTEEFSGLMNSGHDDDKPTCVIGTDENTQTLITECDETAFAYGGELGPNSTEQAGQVDQNNNSIDGYAHCFPLDGEISENQWGWSNGKLSEGNSYTFPIYAGAGRCILSSGQYAGDLEIDYQDGKVTVKYIAAPGSSFKETHLYIGSNKMPTGSNTGYGNYPYNDSNATSVTPTEVVHEVDITGDIYIAAHSVVYGSLED
ncbi:hypothetical protein CWD77_11785 [Rhodohalobacter barkolensis]|uniref:Uncharacterized protein n=2 Tax=Rhodohalobacter barkolensis TaxID=2053187 RepID=A0A2N0VGI8_9BACT|nr:hypothetical protein CWD77_11785 [Rhodohalobacter barkolensis]